MSPWRAARTAAAIRSTSVSFRRYPEAPASSAARTRSVSPNEVRTTISTSSYRRRIARVDSIPSSGCISRSISTTCGRFPTESSSSSMSSARSPPSASPTTAMSLSPFRNADSPCRTTAWSSTTKTRMTSSVSVAVVTHLRRHLDANDRPTTGRADDVQGGADLVGAAAHRFEPEVPGVDGSWIEAAAVVDDLEHDLLRCGSDADVRCRRLSMLHAVGEGFAGDAEELRLRGPRQRQWVGRPFYANADGSPRERRDVTRERRNEPVADPLGPPLEDEAPHLALGALRQLVDRSQRLPEPVVGAVVLERLLRRAGVQHAREER